MSERTAEDVIRSDECNTYVMSCHLNRDYLYKAMREDIGIMCDQYAALKVRNDKLLAALRKYGDHLPDCALEINHPMINRCTCGYHEAITNAENDKP